MLALVRPSIFLWFVPSLDLNYEWNFSFFNSYHRKSWHDFGTLSVIIHTVCLPLSVPCREMKGALRLMHIATWNSNGGDIGLELQKKNSLFPT